MNCKVKLKSNFTISVMKCKQMWLFHVTRRWGPWVVPGTRGRIHSLAAQRPPFCDSDFKAGASPAEAEQGGCFQLQPWHGARRPPPLSVSITKSGGRWPGCHGVLLNNVSSHQSLAFSGPSAPPDDKELRGTTLPAGLCAASFGSIASCRPRHLSYGLQLSNGARLAVSRMECPTEIKLN